MNTIIAKHLHGNLFRAPAVYQYDYGQILQIQGLELPEAYEVHFSNSPMGTSTTSIGTASGVVIPDVYLQNGSDVYAWIFLHQENDDGETVYQIVIPVQPRASISDQPPTPVQQDVITQTIAALNDGVQEVNDAVEGIPAVIDAALQEAKDSGEFDGKDGKDGKDGEDGADGFSPIVSVSEITGGHEISITDAQGTETFDVLDGKPGEDGVDGKDGEDGLDGVDGHSPVVTASKSGSVTTISVDGTAIATVNDGQDGQDGQNGHSPVVTASKSGTVTTVSVDGEPIATINDGQDGQNGQNGQDGYSPTASVSKSGSTATITITDKNGTTTAQISDGSSSEPPWELIREDSVTNATEDAVYISVDGNGNAFEISSMRLLIWTPAQETTAILGGWGAVTLFKNNSTVMATNLYNTASSKTVNPSDSRVAGFLQIEYSGGMAFLSQYNYTNLNGYANLTMKTYVDTSLGYYPFRLNPDFGIDKIKIHSITGTISFRLYGRRKV